MSPRRLHAPPSRGSARPSRPKATIPPLIAAILQQRTEKALGHSEKLGFFDTPPEYDTALYVHKKSKCDETVALDMFQKDAPASRGHHRLGRRRPCTTA